MNWAECDANGYELPDPPENPSFAELPEAFQDRIADRFEHGIRLTRELNALARREHRAQVRAMYARRDKFKAIEAQAKAARTARARANKASLGELGLADAIKKAGRK